MHSCFAASGISVVAQFILITFGYVAGRASGWLSTTNVGKWLDGLEGVFFIGLAIRLLMMEMTDSE
jgi:threonine/homoserine/homoserine lactone efflux protein